MDSSPHADLEEGTSLLTKPKQTNLTADGNEQSLVLNEMFVKQSAPGLSLKDGSLAELVFIILSSKRVNSADS